MQEAVDAVSNALTFNLPYKSETLGENSTAVDCGLKCSSDANAKCATHVFYTHSKTCNLFERQAHSGEVSDYKGYDVHRKLGCPGESGGRGTSNTALSKCAEKCNDWRDCVSFAHNRNNYCYLSSKCHATSSTIKEVQYQDLFVKRNTNNAEENIPTHGPKHIILGNSKNQWCIGLINTDSTLAFTRRTKDTSTNLYTYTTSLVLQENGTVLNGIDLASNNNYNAWEAAYDWEEHKDMSLCFGYCSLHFVGSQTRRVSVDSRANRVPVGKILFTLFADDQQFIITHSNGRVLFYLRADGRFQQMNKAHGLAGSFQNNPTMPEVAGEGRSLHSLLKRGGAKWGAVGLYETDDNYVDWSTLSGHTNIGLPESGTLWHDRPGHCINYDFNPEARGGRCDWWCRYLPFHSEADGQCSRYECSDCDACLPGRAPSTSNVPDNYSGEGKCWNLNSRVGWSDKTASMSLRPGVRVDFYEHPNKTGTKIYLDNETANTKYIASSWLRGNGVSRNMTSIAVQVRKTRKHVEIKPSVLKLGNRFKIQSKEDGSLIFGFLKKDETRVDPWQRTGGRICPAYLSESVHTGDIPCNSYEFPDSPATYPNNEHKCYIKVNGTCRHTIPLRYWFDDSSLGGPKATSERACAERRDSFKHFCGNVDVEHKFVFPGSNSYDPANAFKGTLQGGMEIALWCEEHGGRFVRMYRGEMGLSPPRATPTLPSSWQSERFTLVSSENGREFALYSKQNRRYVRMPRRESRMDATDQMNMHYPAIPNGMGWERFEFISLGDGKYAVKCPRSAGGFGYMRAKNDGYVDAAPHQGSWETFHLMLVSKPITPFKYLGGAGCTNNVGDVQKECTGTCEVVAQQFNGCWHKLKIDSESEASGGGYGYGHIKVKTSYGAFLTAQ